VQNDQCQTVAEAKKYKWPPSTEEGEWKIMTMQLKAGLNILYWKTIGMSLGDNGRKPKPVRIKSIEITGVAYTSECSPCEPGTYSSEGSKLCTPCAENTYSGKGASSCIACNNATQYAPKGSAYCLNQPPCTEQDFYEIRSPCDENKETSLIYKWVEPKLCRTDIDGAVSLSPSGKKLKCPPCSPGMEYVNKSGCTFCPKDHYSNGSVRKLFYFLSLFFNNITKGSAYCLNQPPCTEQDFYEIRSPCDENKETSLIYKWVEPKLCRTDIDGAVSLSPSGKKLKCPPCSPGMEYVNKSGCTFCPKDHYSNGSVPCQRCPASTAPNYGLLYKWWHDIPLGFNTRCMSVEEGGCKNSPTWQPAGDHIHSALGHRDDVFLILSLDVSGFRGRERVVNGHAAEIGRVSFVFELDCTGNCYFVFMFATNRKEVSEIQSWSGKQEKQHFSYPIVLNDTYIFNWAFQRQSYEEIKKHSNSDSKNIAKIYEITVTNTVDGGASECLPCPQGTEAEGCIPCPPGHYIKDKDSLQCLPCPSNTYVSDPFPYGIKSCKPCGPGLYSDDGQNCQTNCKLNFSDGQHYDLTSLPPYVSIYLTILDFSIESIGPQLEEDVHALVCRSTIIPSQTDGSDSVMAFQAVSLGDNLIGISPHPTLRNISVAPEFIQSAKGNSDVHFFYSSSSTTPACSSGRTTTLTLRCDKNAEGSGHLSLPANCPDGTCDGCNFHFLWQTVLACRICTESDYQVVKGECIHGVQTFHYISPMGCIPPNADDKPLTRTQPCSAIPQELQIVIGASVALGLLLFTMVLYFWKKNRKLEYKYMKLVQSSSSKDGELPTAESCAIEDDEEDHFESMTFNEKGRGIFGKFRTIRIGNDKEGTGIKYETIHLTRKETLS
ncbi:UPF0577 protein KIAA1324-like, partial [Centruroides sculpturatus]|uniref:UPF0577 protein KIAA1324-like n=1 Tax=Centruroides sculpturatus TaxID=218467 RepID=UPI000C6E184B